jgi:hypothetical protein
VTNALSATHSVDLSFVGTPELDEGLNEELRARIKRELEPGERLLWAARSEPPLELHLPHFYVWSAIALMSLGLGLYLLTPPRGDFRAADGGVVTWGIFFAGVACVIVASLLSNSIARRREWRRLGQVCYAITDRRAISWIPQPLSKAVRVEALGRGSCSHLVRIETPDGSGNLELGRISFDHIPEVRRVEQIVRSNLMTNERNT